VDSRFQSLLHVIASALVLALPGITLLGLLQVWDLQRSWAGHVPFVIELNNDASMDTIEQIKKAVMTTSGIDPESLEFAGRAEAFKVMKQDESLGLNDGLTENPFRDLILAKSNGTVSKPEVLKSLKNNLLPYKNTITRTDAGQGLSDEMNKGLGKILLILIALTIFFVGLAYFIIHYLLRNLLHRRAEIIQTMHLLGASDNQVFTPYRSLSLRLGLASGFFAIVWVGISILILFVLMPDLYKIVSLNNFAAVITVLAILGPTLHRLGLKKTIQSLTK